MIYEQAMLEHNYKTEIVACLLDLGFVEVPGSGNNDPAKYYWGPDTRREFYLYFADEGLVSNMYCHITTDAGEYTYRLSPWKNSACMSMATWTRLYGGGIRFGIRAEQEYLIDYENETFTDYKYGYRNEELYAAFMPAHWFAIIAPEDPERDQWIYCVYRRYEQLSGIRTMIYNIGASIFTEEGYINEDASEDDTQTTRPDGYILNRDNVSAGNETYNDFLVSQGLPIILMPYMWGDVTWQNATPSAYITKIYNNIFHMSYEYGAGSYYDGFAMNRVISYGKKSYINIAENKVFVRYE